MNARRLKIFISAYACEPEKGSEPGIGWNVVNELAKYHEVHVLTRANNLDSIKAALPHDGQNPIFYGYDLPKWLTFWKKKRRGYHLYYYLWQYGAFFQYRKLVNHSGFDIVQHLTFANFAMPSLFMLCKPVTIWGPIGRTGIPSAVFRSLPFKIKWKERFRLWFMKFLCIVEPFRFLTPLCADCIIESGFLPNQSGFSKSFAMKVISHPQTGINSNELEYRAVRQRNNDGKIRLLICSEFFHWKGVTIAAEIFCRIAPRHKEVELYIYGSGPEKKNMEAIFQKFGIEAQRIHWKGFVTKQEMLQALLDADILLYPSYHHGLATVILQAMYAKLPIVAMAGDPVGNAVSEGAGLVADGDAMTAIMKQLEDHTERLITSATLRRELGQKGRELVETKYEWSILAQNLSSIFQHIIQETSRKG